MRKKKLIYLFPVLCAILVVGGSKVQAQVTGGLKVKIPFAFHVGRAILPAGNYTINPFDGVESNLIEIRNDDNHSAALVQTMDDPWSTSKTPQLLFDRTGGDYYLERIFDQDGSSSEVIPANNVKK